MSSKILVVILVLGIVFISGCSERSVSSETLIYNLPPDVIISPVTFTDDGLCRNEEYSTYFSLGDVALTSDGYTELEIKTKESPDALWSISNLVCLEFLYLGGISHISNISALANLTNLKSLNLLETNVSDISPLSNLKNLERLYLTKTPVSDIYTLRGLTSLKLLSMVETKVPKSDCDALKLSLRNTEILCADWKVG